MAFAYLCDAPAQLQQCTDHTCAMHRLSPCDALLRVAFLNLVPARSWGARQGQGDPFPACLLGLFTIFDGWWELVSVNGLQLLLVLRPG